MSSVGIIDNLRRIKHSRRVIGVVQDRVEKKIEPWMVVSQLSDLTTGHATELPDRIFWYGRNFMSYNGQRAHTRHRLGRGYA